MMITMSNEYNILSSSSSTTQRRPLHIIKAIEVEEDNEQDHQQQEQQQESEDMFYIGSSESTDLEDVVVSTNNSDDDDTENYSDSRTGEEDPEDELGPSSFSRSPSPTSILADISLSSSSTSATSGSIAPGNASKSLTRSVSWKNDIVTDVIYRPKTNPVEKTQLFYNKSDMQRFRRHYKMQVKAARKSLGTSSSSGSGRRTTTTATSSVTTSSSPNRSYQHHYSSPISGLVNMMTSYMAGGGSSNHNSNSPSVAPIPANSHNHLTSGLIADTCVLVDTLYLF